MKTIVQLVSELKTYFTEKDTASRQAAEANIAPVEADASSASKAYAVGQQLVLNDTLYDVTASISIGDALVVGTNISVADDVITQIKEVKSTAESKQDQLEVTLMPTASASNVGKVLIYIGSTTSDYTSGHSYQSTLEDGSYIWKDVSGGSPTIIAEDVEYDNSTSGLSGTNVQMVIDELAEDKINTTDIANNLTTTVQGKVLDARQGKSLNDLMTNKNKVTSIQVGTSGWTADSTSQSGNTLYKKSISLTNVYVESPSVDIGAASGSILPTVAQQTAYDLLQYVTIDGTTMYLYASNIPTDAYYINVKGVD